MENLEKINKINVPEHSLTILNKESIEKLIKSIKDLKLPMPLAIHIESKSTSTIILKKKEDKKIYQKVFTVVPWISDKKFEYILNISKFTTSGAEVIKVLEQNNIKSVLEPIFIEDIFTGTFNLYTNKKVDEKLRNFTKDNITYYINIKKHVKMVKKIEKQLPNDKDQCTQTYSRKIQTVINPLLNRSFLKLLKI